MITSPGTSLSRTPVKSPRNILMSKWIHCASSIYSFLYTASISGLQKGKNTNEFKVNGVLVMHE